MGSGRYWKKHQNKELEALLHEFHAAGWTIEDPPVYYHVKCPCGDHQRWIHLTPSGNGYIRDASKWLQRQECMQEEGRDDD